MTDKRALLIGVETYLDEELANRPGTLLYLGRIARRLELGGWNVALLTDDAPDESRRPLLANILGRLEWIAQADEAFVVLSGHVRGARLLPRDVRSNQLERTSLTISEVVDALPAKAGLLVDDGLAESAVEGPLWASARNPDLHLIPQAPSSYLAAIADGLGQESTTASVTGTRLMAHLAEVLGELDPDLPFWVMGSPTESVLVSAPAQQVSCGHCLRDVQEYSATYCPHCGRMMADSGLIDNGRYRLVETLGQGGMGHVYLAHDTRLGLDRALKLLSLPPGIQGREAEILRARLVQEARAAQTLGDKTHHVVRVFDVGHSSERDVPFLVMEVLRGETLRARIERGGISVDQAVGIAHQIAQTLAIAHPQGMIHRDLKPSNIMLVHRDGREDFVKLLDFGLVKVANAELLTESGLAMGTLQYMPPEQLQGETVDARADVFALGAVLFECLTGLRANPGQTQYELFRVLLDSGVQPIGEIRPDLPAELCAIVDRCLALDPEARFPHGGAVAVALEPFVGPLEMIPSGVKSESLGPSESPNLPVESPASEISIAHRETVPGRKGLAMESTPSLATGEISLHRPTPARWPLLAAGILFLGIALVWGLDGDGDIEGGETSPAVSKGVVAPANPAPVTVGDASPIPVINPTPVAPTPFSRPSGPLPAAIEALRRVEDDGVFYRGPDKVHAFASIVRDVTLGTRPPAVPDAAADETWRTLSPGVRAWLAEGVDLDGIESHPEGLRLTIAHLSALRTLRPSSQKIRRLGRLWTAKKRRPVFSAVNCGRARSGDRVVTARWKVLGYSDGRCAGDACPRALARAMQKAGSMGEQLRLDLELERLGEEGDESTTTRTRCVLR